MVQILAIMYRNDIDPMPPPTLEWFLTCFSFEDTSVRLKSLGMFHPIDEDLFVELFNWQIYTLIQRTLCKLLLWSHIEHQCHIFMIVHIHNLLSGCHSDLHRCSVIEKFNCISDDLVLLDSLNLLDYVVRTTICTFYHFKWFIRSFFSN